MNNLVVNRAFTYTGGISFNFELYFNISLSKVSMKIFLYEIYSIGLVYMNISL